MDTRITLKQLRFFLAVAQKRHFRKAAESEGVTQPSLSAQIANLEHELGLQLVERGGREIMLTAPGREIHARAQRVMEEVRGLADLSVSLRAGTSGVLNVGVSSTVGPYLMPHVVRDLHRSYPDMGLFIREGAPRALEVELLQGEHDIIISQLPLRSSDVMTVPVFREPLFLVVADDHRLAGQGAAQDSDLAGMPVLTLGQGYALNDIVTSLCADLGATLMVNYQGTSLDAQRQMIGMGMGCGFLPALYIESEIRGRDSSVAIVPFRPGRLNRTVGCAWRRSTGRMRLIELLVEQLRGTIRDKFGPIVTAL
ncbi:hydrogen peroxide-inducible genes activator [Sedimentitalea arenosa]|uniref:LysR family transcriptional regulator n=1 Tax=Sedimentitalea arenosa TaxID=2798803 RepID=A0A8J7J921_9RHOB|nr:hydrogen peroxide-inducible genes activator [Arenibacterium arenosum]MBJ6371213.1 LysR family transcriptional regulator [Arenibacterium arenosum]